MRNEIYLNIKLRMDQAVITTVCEKSESKVSNLTLELSTELIVLREEYDCQSIKAQTKKSKTPRLF